MRYVAVCALLLLVPTATATTYLVCPDGTGDFSRIQEAIDAAADGDSIELCCDVVFCGYGNRDLNFHGKILTLRSVCDDPERCAIDAEGSWSQFRRVFGFFNAETADAQISGITLQGGVHSQGGGVYCSFSSPTFVNCVFTGNEIAAVGGRGAAVFCRTCSPSFIDCRFEQNACTWSWCEGGAVACYESAPAFANCSFLQNDADASGSAGAVYCEEGSDAVFEDCLFRANSAGISSGAVGCHSDSRASFEDCLFRENTAGVGGAVFLDESDATMTGCTIIHNRADLAGGIAVEYCAPTIRGCMISHNIGDMFGGGIYCASATPILENTIISFSLEGESVYLQGTGVPTLTCCDFYGNQGGDWRWPLINQLETNGNICLDPCYCDAALDDFRLWNYSPCNQEGCGLIGAHPVGCWAPQGVEEDVAGREEDGGGTRGADERHALRLVSARVVPNPVVFRGPGASAGAVRIEFELAWGAAEIREPAGGALVAAAGAVRGTAGGTARAAGGKAAGKAAGRSAREAARAPTGAMPIVVAIHDLTGRIVRTLHHGPMSAGVHTCAWRGTDAGARAVPGGVYFARVLSYGREVLRARVLVVR
ncbi:MAG: hypothetical protein GF330_05355 [Candidatus Eisenbacteria bacterium]|nr:hypothetical protein [Candidatus Eisenbacteria bacterium]